MGIVLECLFSSYFGVGLFKISRVVLGEIGVSKTKRGLIKLLFLFGAGVYNSGIITSGLIGFLAHWHSHFGSNLKLLFQYII